MVLPRISSHSFWRWIIQSTIDVCVEPRSAAPKFRQIKPKTRRELTLDLNAKIKKWNSPEIMVFLFRPHITLHRQDTD